MKNDNWTPELKKQLRKVTTNWKRLGRVATDPEILADSYAQWRIDNGLEDCPVAVFPDIKGQGKRQWQARMILKCRLPKAERVYVDPADYVS